MHNLIFEGFATEKLLARLESSPTNKLIKELNYVYGLKVIHTVRSAGYDKFVLGYESNGLPLCSVWTEKELVDGKHIDKYFFRTPYFRKERGNSVSDKETVYSTKLSSLMATLKRQRIIQSDQDMMHHLMAQVEGTRKHLYHSFGNADKRYGEIETNDIHILLSKVLEGKDVEGLQLDLNNCKIALDKYNKAHTIRLTGAREVKRFYDNNFYLVASIGEDSNKHLVVGILKRKDETNKISYKTHDGGGQCTEYEIIKPLKRFTEFSDEHGHLKGLLTMLKVATEADISRYDFNCIPVDSTKYYKDLDMFSVVLNNFQSDYHNLSAVLIPCGEA